MGRNDNPGIGLDITNIDPMETPGGNDGFDGNDTPKVTEI